MRLTTKAEEQQWQEFKRHIEWSKKFSLLIFFVADDALADVFKTRLYHQQQGRVEGLKTLKPEHVETLTEDFFVALKTEVIPDVKAPLWLEIYQHSDEWDAARDNFFARLNEYRDQLRFNFPYPVIILVPLTYKSRLRDIAPDLWSVRSFTDELLSNSVATHADTTSEIGQSSYQVTYDFQAQASDIIEIAEWQRIQEQPVSAYEYLQVGWRAFDKAFNLGDRKLAEEIVNACLSRVQQHIKTEDETDFLRYLSVFLNKKGDLENALGRREAAYQLYQESLKIRRRLLDTLGETPDTLHDLCVSLYLVAELESTLEQNSSAKKYYKECLKLLERLDISCPENEQYKNTITEIEKKLSQL